MRWFCISCLAAALVIAACSSDDRAPITSAPDASASDAAAAKDVGSAIDADVKQDATKNDASTCKLTKPYSSKDTTCNACAEEQCCGPVNACYSSADCDDGYVNCIIACVLLPDDAGADAGDAGPQACLAQCGAQYPTGKALYDALSTCVETSCKSECE